MSVVLPITRLQRASTVKVVADNSRDVYWMHMHAHLATTSGRPCFSSNLLDDLIEHQQIIRNEVNKSHAESPFMVLVSDSDVFNLGGDLELFCGLIRRRDRDALLDYARRCIQCAHAFTTGLHEDMHCIALVQGNALGGGFEVALSCHTIVAEEGAQLGLPEVLFDLFPGMGAYSFLCQRMPPRQAERLMLEGNMHSAEELHRLGVVDHVVPRGEGLAAVEQIIREGRRIPHAWKAVQQAKRASSAPSLDELMKITEIWVDTALQLGDKSLRTMERLFRAQDRRSIRRD
ncbi:crotonase/enoyl-CoA hydratase family protein [Xanthomonas nasturtii]|uniref:crotonase/enoyl-CoA hydratase family protein n=1 Tax=Xanthomonas nasturtii TaxID=1843581 RepID=UPI002012FF86|nr:crotonase/enoyl-CoA hydratase family protein [Xanthomonas nasturtii]MCL1544333.1 crotonase/enoyl-CoA hydratase family protein [Xanthomonas nasturtii]